MRRLKTIVAALALIGSSVAAEAHAMFDHASPALGSTISTPPGQVTLYFTEQLEPKFSGAEVRKGAGNRVDRGVSVSGKVMRVSVGSLAAGTYTVTWHVLSVDTHKTQGSFSFTVGK